MNKRAIRENMEAQRLAMSPEEVYFASKGVFYNLKAIPEFNMRNFFVYVSIGNEVSTEELINKLLFDLKKVTVPKSYANRVMIPVEINSIRELQPGRLGFLEPESNEPFEGIEVCIAPGLAFNEDGVRIGTGNGYYDKFLAEHPKVIKIGLAYEFQIFPSLLKEDHDQLMDIIVTESRVIR